MKTILYLLLLLPSLSFAETKVTGREIASLHNSSSTVGTAAYSVTQTSPLLCVAQSTVTLTTTGGSVLLSFVGSFNMAGAGTIGISPVVDGVRPNTGQYGLTAHYQATATGGVNLSFSYVTSALSTGSHSFCVAVSGSNGLIGNNYVGSPYFQFAAVELK